MMNETGTAGRQRTVLNPAKYSPGEISTVQENISNISQIAYLVIQLGVIIFAAHLFGTLAQKVHIPAVLGEVLAGIIIGPYLLGGLNLGLKGFEQGLFPLAEGSTIPISMPLYGIAILGSIILLFISGLETDLGMFLRFSIAGSVVGLGGMIVSFAFGAGFGMLALGYQFLDPRTLFLAILCTATSVGITARILADQKSIDSPEGTTILAAAVIDDVLGIICLAVVMGMIGSSDSQSINWRDIEKIALKSFGIWLGITAAGLYFAHKIAFLLRARNSAGVFSLLAFAGALLLAGFFEQVGLAMIIGAYVTGLCLSKTDISFSIERSLRGIYSFLVPVFFVVMGMLVDVRGLSDSKVIAGGLLYALLAILAKVIGCALPARALNFNRLGALRIGLGMIPRGEVALIIAGIGATTMMNVNGSLVPVIDAKLFGMVIIMTLLTTLAAPPLLSMALNRKGKGVKRDIVDNHAVQIRYTLPDPQLVDILLRELAKNFLKEDFLHSGIGEGRIIQFRRAEQSFALEWQPQQLCFEAHPRDIFMIKAVIRETVADLHATVNKLKLLNNGELFADLLSTDDLPGLHPDHKIAAFFDTIVPPGCVVIDFQPDSAEDAVIQLVNILNAREPLLDPLLCINDILANENISSSCFPGGLALPHARSEGTGKLVSIIALCRKGFPLQAGNNEEIRAVILSLCPRHAHEPYLKYLSYMAAILAGQGQIDRLLQCRSQREVRRFFKPQSAH